MFDREKQVVINRICKSIFDKSDSVTLKEINSLSIPQQLKNYLNCEVDQLLEEEIIELKNFSKFNYEHHEVKPFFDQFCVILKLHKSFTHPELSLLLKNGLDLTLDYLLKPCEVLTNFIFKYDTEIDSDVIKKKLSFITDYEYLTLIVEEFLKRKGNQSINRDAFYELLKKIDKEYTTNFTLLDHYELFKSFKNYLSELDLMITDRAEYEAFIIYLNDKSHKSAVEFLEERRGQFIQSNTSVVEFLKILFQPKLYEDKPVETTKSQIQKVETADLNEFDETQEETLIAQEEKFSEHLEELRESSEIFGKVEVDSSEQDQSEITESEISKTPAESILYQKLISRETVPQKKFDRNLDGLMPGRLKKKVINKIFDGNEMMFYDFINQLNKVNNWDEASLLLTDLFDKRNIQPFSKWAIKFTEFLYDNIR